ncbi:hypothetical protein Tco_1059897 [Tanacetum coccineum]
MSLRAKRTILCNSRQDVTKWYQSHTRAIQDGEAYLIEDDESLKGVNGANLIEDNESLRGVGSVEEAILEREKQKMSIDAKVIQAGLFNTTATESVVEVVLVDLLEFYN